MSRFRIIGLAAALLFVSLVSIETTVHLSGVKVALGTSPEPSRSQALTTPIVAAISATSPTPLQAAPMSAKPTPQEKQNTATDAVREKIEAIEQLHREISSQRAQIDELRQSAAKQLAEVDKITRESSRSSTDALRAQFHGFAERFVAADDSLAQNSKPNPTDLAGTRAVKVSLISDEITSTGGDEPAKGVLSVKQSEDFRSYDGRTTWSREWTTQFLFEKKSDRWHCTGGDTRMTKDGNSARAGRSPWIGVAIPLGAESWDNLDIR